MKHLIISFSVVLLCIISACEKVIDAKDLPEQDPRLAVNCILYPDSEASATVSLSKSIVSSKKYRYINNAICALYEDDSFIGNLTLAANGTYTSNIMPKTGKKYTLNVTAAGYSGVSGTSSLPGNVTVANVERYDTANYLVAIREFSIGPSTMTRNLQASLKYRIRVADDPTVKNYYSIRPLAIWYDNNDKPTPLYNISIQANENGLGNNNVTYSGQSVSFDDQAVLNGKDILLDVSINFSDNLDYSATVKNIKVYLEVYNLSAEYYRYLVTLNNQYSTGAAFFAEPVQVYSNVSSGMGIIAGVNTNSVSIYPQ